MNDVSGKEDTHFYIDFAPPAEVSHVLRVLSVHGSLSIEEIADVLRNDYGFEMQSDKSYSPKRLFDLGLAEQAREGGKLKYRLSERGRRVQVIQATDDPLARELLHYLHFSSYGGNPSDRKYLWSYRRCCEHIWSSGQFIEARRLAASVQADMAATFPRLDFGRKVGARFNNTAASCVYSWLGYLQPSPLVEAGRKRVVEPRTIERHQLVVLALDDVYRSRGYRYGDPVLATDSILKDIAGVFFLDDRCCFELLRLAARIVPCLKMSDTLGGTSVSLLQSFSVDDV